VAALALSEVSGVLDVEVTGSTIVVGLAGGDELLARMVAELVARGIGVIGVEQERNELERIFLAATARGEARSS
jgi:hypothetical protein